jgi:hypothetical protein
MLPHPYTFPLLLPVAAASAAADKSAVLKLLQLLQLPPHLLHVWADFDSIVR